MQNEGSATLDYASEMQLTGGATNENDITYSPRRYRCRLEASFNRCQYLCKQFRTRFLEQLPCPDLFERIGTVI